MKIGFRNKELAKRASVLGNASRKRASGWSGYICKLEGCNRKASKRGFCVYCYDNIYRRNLILLKKYGISLSEYLEISNRQKGACAICGKGPGSYVRKRLNQAGLRVDHDHKTGKVRGLLCNECNMGLGQLGDSIEAILKVLRYLQEAG